MISKRYHFPFLKMQQNVGLPREWSHCQSLVEKRDLCIQSDQTNQKLNWLLTSVHILGWWKYDTIWQDDPRLPNFGLINFFLSRKVEGIPTADMDYCPSQQTVVLICYRKVWMFEIKSTHLGILSLLLATLSISITNSGVWKTRTIFRWISTKNNFFWHRAGRSPFKGARSTFGKLHLWRIVRHHISRDWVPGWKLGGEITWRWWCPPHHDTMRHPWGKWGCFIWNCKTNPVIIIIAEYWKGKQVTDDNTSNCLTNIINTVTVWSHWTHLMTYVTNNSGKIHRNIKGHHQCENSSLQSFSSHTSY